MSGEKQERCSRQASEGTQVEAQSWQGLGIQAIRKKGFLILEQEEVKLK